MCGIVAVLSRSSGRPVPSGTELLARLQQAAALLGTDGDGVAERVASAAEAVAGVDHDLRGESGVLALLDAPSLREQIAEAAEEIGGMVAGLESALDAGSVTVDLEAVNAGLVRLKDAVWAIDRDRLRTAIAVDALAGPDPSPEAVRAYLAVQVALSAIDRLEVRGRDSAGLHVLVAGPGVDLDDAGVQAELAARAHPLFVSGSVRAENGCLGFVYKAAAEIGELGDNTAALRSEIAGDELLRRAVSGPAARVTVLAHTRWASVGMVSEPNAHPLDSDEVGQPGDRPYVLAALNGDVDNHAELRTADGLQIPPDITTDAKVIPTLVARRMVDGVAFVDAFRSTVARFDGSVAIGTTSASDPDRVALALRGSGQALYVGLADDTFVVASEVYGLVEITSSYLRLDGETGGQVVMLDRDGAGTIDGLTRLAYAGTEAPVTDGDLHQAEITTRDIDRAGAPHFLLKEIGEAPRSVRKTLRGKLEERRGVTTARLPAGTLPDGLAERVANGSIRRILVTGQGTAAIAGRSVARCLVDALGPTGITVAGLTAAELSGFGLDDDMGDTLVVAVSQSGTSADTNRTVDLIRARGGTVVSIVNRRNSDLVDKSDGVLYTSDGRDVEMAVPSTKAFYAQIAAGFILAWGLAAEAGVGDRHRGATVLEALRKLPDAMDEVLARRDAIAAVAQHHALSRRYWAMVGNGPNRIAAEELRIKLSELCYKSISFDITEDKKHIDLSAEPLIMVCAAGLDGVNADDVAKEVAIFRAHKAAPIVIASDGERRFDAALDVIEVPSVHPDLDFVLAAMAGHLFGYEAAVAIDAQARQLRELRGLVEAEASSGHSPDEVLDRVKAVLDAPVTRFFHELQAGAYNGNLGPSTAVRLASLLRYGRGLVPLDVYELEYGKVGSPEAMLGDLLDALSDAIDELTRPIDAIKHQAKTVTVGTSRAEESYADVPLVGELLATGVSRDRVGYRGLRAVAQLDLAVVAVTGYTRYQVEGSVADGTATIAVVDKGGDMRDVPSRTESDPVLKGTKRRAAFEREVTASRGARDGRTLVIVPETKDNQVNGITLLHVEFAPTLAPADARRVLTGYRNRYNALVDAVTETEPSFDDEVLGRVPLIDLLVEPVHVLASHWRR